MGSPPDEYDDAVTELTRHVLKYEPVDQSTMERSLGRVNLGPHPLEQMPSSPS